MNYLGDFRVGSTVRKMFNTNAVAGESITMATNGTVVVYKDGGLTESTAGVTFTEDFDGLTGVHLVSVDTSASGTFYSAGSDFEVVLQGSVIDGKSINATLFSFSLENRSALMPTVSGRKLDVSTGGEAGIDWSNIGSASSAVSLTNTTIKTAVDVETDTIDIQSRLPAALVSGKMDSVADASSLRSALGMASANLDTQLSNIKTKTDVLPSSFPTNFSVLSIDASGRVVTTFPIKKGTALNNYHFVMIDSTDHITPKTGLTVTAQRVIDGGSAGACTNSVVEVGSGIYRINLSSSDLNGDIITLIFSASGADTTYATVITQS